jgi:poly-beta-1,6-N-acetyl-D-glucosamine synthase
MKTARMRLAIVVPCLDEERHLPGLLDSIAAQTRAPDQLLVVDDGSTDGSVRIAAEFAREHVYARVLQRPPRRPPRDRLAAAAELVAVQWAVDRLAEPWDVVGKLDADLVLSPDTLAALERAFAADPRLGMAGAYLSERVPGDAAVRKPCPPEHVEGATKFYRRECWEDIAPLPAIVGWDMFDELRARMRGWRTASFEMPGSDPLHQRPMGAQDGVLRAHRRWGAGAYAYGEHPLHVALLALRDVRAPPPVLGSLNYVAGWAIAALRRGPRAEPELRAYVRRHQLHRIRRRLVGS